MKNAYGELDMSSKVFHSDPHRDRLVCERTFKLLNTLKKLGLPFNVPIREILQPASMDGIMLDKFFRAFVRVDDDK